MRWDILLLLLATVARVPSERPPVRGMYSRQRRSTDESEHKIVYPRKVTNEGILISHDVTHYHDGDEDQMLHLQVAVAGSEYHLELKPVVNFVSPATVVERWSLTSRTHEQLGTSNCYYQGSVRGDPMSYVSISTCDGLAGVLLVDNGTLWMEPVEEAEGNGARTGKQVESRRYAFATNASAVSARPHLVFRRSVDVMGAGHRREETSEGTCGTRDPQDEADDDEARTEANDRRRVRRSYSHTRYIETLVVADPDVTRFYKNLDAKTYLLTIFNMVAALVRHPSVGNDLNIVIVGMILLEHPEPNLKISANADKTLQQFCIWSHRGIYGNEPLPNHDVAVLVTRTEFCKADTSCNTLGVAHVKGMCKPEQSCLVARDNGLLLAYTIAHELGHNLGAHHDDSESRCYNKELRNTLMVPVLSADVFIKQGPWSSCSRKYITNYLDHGIGDCLDNKPAFNRDYEFPYLQHGAMYDSSQQCQIAFNVSYSYVCEIHQICSQLWCQIENKCISHFMPAAPGTNCGRHMWCQDQQCVPIKERPKPIHGNWGNWTSWSECQGNPCSRGISIKERQCSHPSPKNGGKYCIGQRRQIQFCDTDCADPQNRHHHGNEGYHKKDLRATLCKTLGLKVYKNDTHLTWKSNLDDSEPCLLTCEADNGYFLQKNDLDILNGLPCGPNGICVYGMCYKYGCDNVIGSNLSVDRCGICGGDGTQCKTVEGVFNNTSNKKDGRHGYLFGFTIPSGSRNLNLSEPACFPTNVAIRSARRPNVWYYHGNLTDAPIADSKIIGKIAGASAEIDVSCGREKITFFEPIQEDISVYCHVQTNALLKYCVIKYSYDKPLTNLIINREYSWEYSDEPLPCSVTCGQGLEEYPVICVELPQRTPVDERFCKPEKKLRPKSVTCDRPECLASWWTGEWQPCSTKCGEGRQTRSVLCTSESQATVDADCEGNSKPKEIRGCLNKPCDPVDKLNSHNRYKNLKTYNAYNSPFSKDSERYIVDSLDSENPSHKTQGPAEVLTSNFGDCAPGGGNNRYQPSAYRCRSKTSDNERMMSPKRSVLPICTNQMSPSDYKICIRNRKRHRSHLCVQRWCPNGKTGCKNAAGKCIVDKNFCNKFESPKKCCPKCMRRRRHGRLSPRKKFIGSTQQFSNSH